MGNTSFTVLRTARGDVLGLGEPRTQFAELTGAYWLEPIYAGLANEWNRQGRTVPGAPREHRRVLPDGSLGADGPDSCDEPHTPQSPEVRKTPGPQHETLRPQGRLPGALGDSRPALPGADAHE